MAVFMLMDVVLILAVFMVMDMVLIMILLLRRMASTRSPLGRN